MCGIHGCTRRTGHWGGHTPDPPLTTIDWDYHYESVVVRHVMRAIRTGRIDAEPQYIKRWIERESACGLR